MSTTMISESDLKVIREALWFYSHPLTYAFNDIDGEPSDISKDKGIKAEKALALLDKPDAPLTYDMNSPQFKELVSGIQAVIEEQEATQPEVDWVMVPRKLTEEMEDVAARISDGPSVTFQEHWDAMLAASPMPQQEVRSAEDIANREIGADKFGPRDLVSYNRAGLIEFIQRVQQDAISHRPQEKPNY